MDLLHLELETAESKTSYEEALAIYRAEPDTPTLELANAIRGYALLLTEGGEKTPAISLWHEAKDLYSAAQIQAGKEECEAHINKLLLE
jgi:hypothetical protein